MEDQITAEVLIGEQNIHKIVKLNGETISEVVTPIEEHGLECDEDQIGAIFGIQIEGDNLDIS